MLNVINYYYYYYYYYYVCHEDIAYRGCIKGFVYRFMHVRVREKMAGKVIRHPDSVFDGFPNMYFIL